MGRKNPIVQLFYLCVVVGGFLTFVAHGYPHLPNRLVGVVHKYSGFGVFVMCLTVWWRACTTDPGTVTLGNMDDLCEVYEWDDQIFSSSQCKTCELTKPARSKHCSLCNVCVARFDHHCIWINNCVGIGNHRWFLMFLLSHWIICFYGAGLGTTIAYEIVVQKDLFQAVFVDPQTRQRHKATLLIICQYMLATEGLLIFIVVICGVMGLVLFGFFMWHLNLIRMGTTTNELSKWNYLKSRLKAEGEEGLEKLKNLNNIYNQGFRSNFKEVFFPLNVHKTHRAGGKVDIKKDRRKGKDKAKKT